MTCRAMPDACPSRSRSGSTPRAPELEIAAPIRLSMSSFKGTSCTGWARLLTRGARPPSRCCGEMGLWNLRQPPTLRRPSSPATDWTGSSGGIMPADGLGRPTSLLAGSRCRSISLSSVPKNRCVRPCCTRSPTRLLVQATATTPSGNGWRGTLEPIREGSPAPTFPRCPRRGGRPARLATRTSASVSRRELSAVGTVPPAIHRHMPCRGCANLEAEASPGLLPNRRVPRSGPRHCG